MFGIRNPVEDSLESLLDPVTKEIHARNKELTRELELLKAKMEGMERVLNILLDEGELKRFNQFVERINREPEE